MSQDKRVSPRVLFSEPVEFCQPELSINGSIAGNISLTGVSLRVQGFIPVGTVLELQLRLGQSPKIIWARGQVVRIRQALSDDCFEIGLKFINDDKCIKAVGEYINASRFNQIKRS